MQKQKQIFDKTFDDWKKNAEQVDDVVVMGIRIQELIKNNRINIINYKKISKLTDELKQDYIKISGILSELQKIGATSDKGRELLMQSKTALLAHLTKEDEQLYPLLYEKAKTDSGLQRRLDSFAAEMDKITEFVLEFYEKYSDNNDIDKIKFGHDVSTFISL